MSVVIKLVAFGLRQVFDVPPDTIVTAVEQHFRDHSLTLPKALARAHDRAWQALAIALAGDGFADRVRSFFASGDDKGIAEQVRLFLQGGPLPLGGTPPAFRQACLEELKRLRKSGRLSGERLAAVDVARAVAGFSRYTDPGSMIKEARQAVGQVAEDLATDYPNLSRLLRTPPTDVSACRQAGPPLLAAAFAYFFRREVETDDELAHGLFFDGLRQLTADQAKAFAEVNKALATLGSQFDALLEQLGRIEAGVAAVQATTAATHGAVLDLQAELQRLGGLHLNNGQEVRALLLEVLDRLARVGMHKGEVRPQHSFSIRSEDERRAVKGLLARFRQLPGGEQRQVPALLNGLGKLQVGTGDFSGATQSFNEAARAAGAPAGQAEARHNAYRAALEEQKWDEALEAIQEAAALEAGRFAPFPFQRYHPQRILGAGGFGTAFLCQDAFFRGREVVVKALHAAELERGLEDVFAEAHALSELNHPAIIGVLDCSYADLATRSAPYIVMPYFPGVSLEQLVQQHEALSTDQVVAIACQVAAAMRQAHARDILHRDLKPDNILVHAEKDRWQVKVIDFGLALRRQTIETSLAARSAGTSILGESVAGTLKYALPEQMGELRGVKPGPYSDVFAFGKTCCYALFRTTEPKSRHWASVPKELAELLERCTEQELEHRYPNFEPVLAVLDALDPEQARCREETRRKTEAERQRLKQEAEQRARQVEEQRRKTEAERQRRERAEAERQQREAEAARQREEERRQTEAEQRRRADEQRQRHEREQAQRQERQAREQRPEAKEQPQRPTLPRREGEAQLARLIRDALERSGGKPTKADHEAAEAIVRQAGLCERASAIIAEVQKQWQRVPRPTEPLEKGSLSRLWSFFTPWRQTPPQQGQPNQPTERRLCPPYRHVEMKFPWSLDTATPVPRGAKGLLLRLGKEIVLDRLCLKEPGSGRLLLDDVSVSLTAGQRVALVGYEDVEKHAFVYLLPRLLEPTSGEVRIDGHNLARVSLASLQSRVALVMQHHLLFHDTVANNIRCGDATYTLPHIMEAAKIAHAQHFIRELPNGYATLVGEPGSSMSLSEQFRIALARALLTDPALLIVEEPDVDLDDETNMLVDDTLSRIVRGRTVIILPHRPATLRLCDRVLLLHKGRLDASGEHRTLLAENELYRQVIVQECPKILGSQKPSASDSGGGPAKRAPRLTLRTLLAYLDDTLDPTEIDIKGMGLKVAESDPALELIVRIKQILRRRDLTIPPTTGPNAVDPNSVAEYLDNVLANEQVAELEKTCLDSDVHLAEVAACHQILMMVLSEPVSVPLAVKKRMYGLTTRR